MLAFDPSQQQFQLHGVVLTFLLGMGAALGHWCQSCWLQAGLFTLAMTWLLSTRMRQPKEKLHKVDLHQHHRHRHHHHHHHQKHQHHHQQTHHSQETGCGVHHQHQDSPIKKHHHHHQNGTSTDDQRSNPNLLLRAHTILLLLWQRRDSQKILLFLSVNVSYMFIELAVGLFTNSLGLIGDAGHMLFDNAALLIGLVASYISQLPSDAKYTYGYGRVEVLSGFLNSLLLVVMALNLILEAAHRLVDPPEVKTDHLLVTSVVGLLVNIVGLVWFHDHVHHCHGHGGDDHHHGHSHGHSHGHGHSHNDPAHRDHTNNGHSHQELHQQTNGHCHPEASVDEDTCSSSNSNMYGVYLHVLADTLGSVGVIVSSLLIQFKQWHWADPVSSVLISLLILGSTLPLLKDTVLQLLQRVPKEMERRFARALRKIDKEVPEVLEIVQWHCWRHSNETCVASLHLLVTKEAKEQHVLHKTRAIVEQTTKMKRFVTIQIEKQR